MHLDADEFWSGFEELEAVPLDVGLVTTTMELSHRPMPRMEYGQFKRAQMPYYEVRCFPKVVHRPNSQIRIAPGNHSATHYRGRAANAEQILFHHYSIRSYGHFERKVTDGGKACELTPDMGPLWSAHWRGWYQLWRSDRDLFQALYHQMVLSERQIEERLGHDLWMDAGSAATTSKENSSKDRPLSVPPRATPTSLPPLDFYSSVPGWFNFEAIYDLSVACAQPGDRLVEIGCGQGKSMCYLASRTKRACKELCLFAVDTFQGNLEHGGQPSLNALSRLFYEHIAAAGCLAIVRTIQLDSVAASSLFADGSVRACFINASHDYESVKSDIDAWLSKIMRGGFLAGYGYGAIWPDVKKAVDERFAAPIIIGESWFVRV